MAKKRTKKQKVQAKKRRKTAPVIEQVNMVRNQEISDNIVKQDLNKLFAYDINFIFKDLRKTILVTLFVTALLVIIYLYLV